MLRRTNTVSSRIAFGAHGGRHGFAAQTDLGSAQPSVHSPGFHNRNLGQLNEANAAIRLHGGLEVGLGAE